MNDKEKQILRKKEDLILRDFLLSTSCKFTEEEWKKIESEAAWIKLTDDGLIFSQGWVNFFKCTGEIICSTEV